MNIQQELKLRTANLLLREVAQMMGYSSGHSVKVANRIHNVITSVNLGLDAGGYDFKYSDIEFVSKLCQVLGMDADECFDQIDKMSNQLFEWKMAYKPWICSATINLSGW